MSGRRAALPSLESACDAARLTCSLPSFKVRTRRSTERGSPSLPSASAERHRTSAELSSRAPSSASRVCAAASSPSPVAAWTRTWSKGSPRARNKMSAARGSMVRPIRSKSPRSPSTHLIQSGSPRRFKAAATAFLTLPSRSESESKRAPVARSSPSRPRATAAR